MLSNKAVVSSESKYFSPGLLLIDNNQPLGKGPRHLLGANLPVMIGGEELPWELFLVETGLDA